MIKRTLSFLLALTMLATCLIAVPVLAAPADALSDIALGGQWAEKVVMDNDALLGSGTVASNTNNVKYDKTTYTATQIGYHATMSLANFADLNLNNDADGELELSMTITPEGTLEEFKGNDAKSGAMVVRMFPYIDGTAKNSGSSDHHRGLFVEFDKGTENLRYGFPWGANKQTFTLGTGIPVKFLVTKKNGVLTTLMQVKIGDAWVDGTVAEKTMFETEVTDTTGKFTGVGLNFGSNAHKDNQGKINWKFSDATVVQKTPKTARLVDLSEKCYGENDVVPVDFVLPVDYTEASIKVGGEVIKTLDSASYPAGAYTSKLDLKELDADGNIAVVFDVTVDGETTSLTTSIQKTLLSGVTNGGQWADNKVIMDNDALLGSGVSATPSRVSYDKTTHTANQTSYYGTVKLVDFADLEINNYADGELEIQMTVTPTGTIDDFNGAATKTNDKVIRLIPYIDGAAKYSGDASHHLGLTVKYVSSSGKMRYSFPRGANEADFTFGTGIPVKFLVTKKDGKLTTDMQVQIGGEWKSGSTSDMTKLETDVTETTGKFTGLGINFGSDGYTGTMDWVFSDAKLIQKTPKTARLSDLSKKFYEGDEVLPLDFVLPVGYTEASIKVDGEVIGSFDPSAYPAGAYTSKLDLKEFDLEDKLAVVFDVTVDGKATSFTTSIQKTLLSGVKNGGEWAEKVIIENDELLGGGAVTSNTGNMKYDKTTYTATQTGYQATVKLASFADLDMNKYADGELEIQMTVTPTGDAETFKGAATKDTSKVVRVIPYIDGAAKNSGTSNHWKGLYVTHVNSSGAMKYGFPWGSNSTAFEFGTGIPVKFLVSKKDGKLTTDMQVQIGGEWKAGATTDLTKFETDVTDTTGKFTGVGLNFGSSENSGSMDWKLSDAKVIQKVPTGARFSDLSKKLYNEDSIVPIDFVLPVGYTEASIKVDGEIVSAMTPDGYPAGAYTSKLDLSNFNLEDKLPVVFDVTVGGETTSLSTSIKKALVSDITPGGQWAEEKVVMGNDALLDNGVTVVDKYVTYDKATHTASQSKFYGTVKLADFKDLELNKYPDGELEIQMTITPTATVEEFKGATTKNTDKVIRLIPYIDGAAKYAGDSNHHKGLTVKYNYSGDKMQYSFPRGANEADFELGTGIPVKFVVTKKDGKLTTDMQVQIGGEWESGSTADMTMFETDVTETTGQFTGLGVNFGSDNFKGTMDWIFSDAKLIQKVPTGARLADLSKKFYKDDAVVPVDFVLPVGYTDASMTVNGELISVMAADSYPAGAYTSKIDLKEFKEENSLDVVFDVTVGSKTTSLSTTIQKTVIGEIKPSDLWADRVAMDSDTFLSAPNWGDVATRATYTKPANPGESGILNQIRRSPYGDDNAANINPFAGQGTFLYSDENETLTEVNLTISAKNADGTPLSPKNVGMSKDGKNVEFMLSLRPYIDGKIVDMGNYNSGNSLVIKQIADNNVAEGLSMQYYFPRGMNKTAWTDGTQIPMKLVIEKSGTNVTVTPSAKIGDQWIKGTAVKTTLASGQKGVLTGIAFYLHDNNGNASDPGINWILSDASIIEKGSTSAQLADLSGGYINGNNVPVDFALPEGYATASLKIDGKEVAVFESATYEAGAYTADVMLEKINKLGDLPVVLSGTKMDGSTFMVSTTLKVVETGEIRSAEVTAQKNENVVKTTIAFDAVAGSTCKLLVAAYNGDSAKNSPMLDVQVQNLTTDKGGVSTQTVTASFGATYDYYKVFLWSDDGSLTPISTVQIAK